MSDVATLETANASTEQSKFLRYNNQRLVNNILFDHTNDASATTGNAIRLSGGANEKTGLEKSLSVMPGDVISMEVYGKYIDPNHSNLTTALNTLITQVAAGTASAGTVTDGSAYSTNDANPFSLTGLNGTSSSTGTGPKAYLNYLVFDKDFNLIATQSGYQRLSDVPKEDGQNVAHEKLSANITIAQAGYVYIYLSNEETTPVEVYFDDFKVTQVKSPVIASNDYYPFGLTYNSYSRENSLDQKFLFNGRELQSELSLCWYDYGARMFMSDIGRWGSSDPKADKFVVVSPYTYTLNNPIIFVDPDGRDVKPTNAAAYKAIRNTLTAADQAYVKLDKNGMIDKKLINSHTSKSGNFNSLKTLVNDKRTTEVTVASETKYKDSDGKVKTERLKITYSNELEEAKKFMPGVTKDELKQLGMKDEVKGNGKYGETFFPGGEKESHAGAKGSTNGNIQVFISSDLTERDAARTDAHETNGHALFYVEGKDPDHGQDRNVDNPELEKQISLSVKEANKNYDSQKKKNNE